MTRPDRRLVVAVHLLLLAYAVGAAIRQERVTPNYTDFGQFYIGAAVARTGDWSLLYPIPRPGGTRNAGLDADQKPGTAELWRQIGGPEKPKFIYPPVAALLLLPLARLDYPTAQLAWEVGGGLCVWGIAALTGRIFRVLWDRPTVSWAELAIVAGLVLARRSIMELNHGNISHVIGLLNAGAVLALLRNRPGVAVPLILTAAGLKISPACLLILLAVRPSWAAVRSLAICLLVLAATLAVTGVDVWVEYVREIAPTLSRTWLPEKPGDLSTASIHGIVALATPEQRLPPGWATGIKVLSGLTILALAAGYLRDRGRLRHDPARFVGFAAGVVAWSLFFSPILWYQYWYYYVFCVPWLLTYFRPLGVRTVPAAVALFFMFGPWGWVPPFSSSFYAARMMPGWMALTLLVLSLWEAFWPRDRRPVSPAPPAAPAT